MPLSFTNPVCTGRAPNHIRIQQQWIDASLQERMFAVGFGILALALVCVGIYGIMIYTVINVLMRSVFASHLCCEELLNVQPLVRNFSSTRRLPSESE